MENPIRKLIFFQPIKSQHFCNNWRPHSEDFSEKNPIESDVNWYFFVLVERKWWRLCHLSLELRLVQTGVRLKSELMLCSLPRSRLLSYHMLEVPPRRAQKNRKRTNFYRTLSNNFSIFFIGTIFHSDEKILIKKIASVLSQSDHSISIGFFIGIKIDYPYYMNYRIQQLNFYFPGLHRYSAAMWYSAKYGRRTNLHVTYLALAPSYRTHCPQKLCRSTCSNEVSC
jgi:hypothetical protein